MDFVDSLLADFFASLSYLHCFASQIRQLDETANRLMQTHPDTAEQTYSKQREINEEWTQLTVKANSRKEKLLDSYDLQRFLADYRDLMSWINSMMGLVSSDELANDVTGAEALLERHQVCGAMINLLDCITHSNNSWDHYSSPHLTLILFFTLYMQHRDCCGRVLVKTISSVYIGASQIF